MVARTFMLHPGFYYIKRTNRQPQPSTKRIKVVLAHGHPLIREALKHLLEQDGDIRVVGQATDWPNAVERYRLLTPDGVLVDISLPPFGVKGLRLLLNHTPSPRILLLAFSSSQEEVRESIQEGVAGILGNCGSAELARSIRAIYQGRSFFSADVVNLMALK